MVLFSNILENFFLKNNSKNVFLDFKWIRRFYFDVERNILGRLGWVWVVEVLNLVIIGKRKIEVELGIRRGRELGGLGF